MSEDERKATAKTHMALTTWFKGYYLMDVDTLLV